MRVLFRNRHDAGRRLAEKLTHLRGQRLVVVGLPRGGVPVAYEVARALDAPLDVIVVRKLGVPYQPELGFGAVGENGVLVLNDEVMHRARIDRADLARVEARERIELRRRALRFRGQRPPLQLAGSTVVVVDDGLATGGTARAALRVARAHGAERVVLAVPVAPPEAVAELMPDADEVVCVVTPTPFVAIGEWYEDFSQTGDDEVIELLEAAGRGRRHHAEERTGGGVAAPSATPERDDEVTIRAPNRVLEGRLTVPPGALGVVVFVHGSGSSRFSPRNQDVARRLQREGIGTLLFDLLTEREAVERIHVFDVPLLAERLVATTDWLRRQPQGQLPIGYFGASTGAAAALWAAGDPKSPVRAVVSRGGRPDLATPRLAAVHAPTLLIVGEADLTVLELNRSALNLLGCERKLEIVPGATHSFEEPGALDEVSRLSTAWFRRHLGSESRRATA